MQSGSNLHSERDGWLYPRQALVAFDQRSATTERVHPSGMLGIGTEGEKSLGRRHFMELLSVFTSPPVFIVRHGRDEIGMVAEVTLVPGSKGTQPLVLVLGGRSWAVRHVDWTRRIVSVEPTDAPGVARWSGS